MRKLMILACCLLPAMFFAQTKTENEYYKTLIKKYPFSKYPIENTYKGILAKLDTTGFGLPRDIRENISYRYYQTKKPNFANHYIIVTWGCGSPCQENMIIDANNGKDYETINSAQGLKFQLNSNLIIWNPPEEVPYDLSYRKMIGDPKFFLWIENRIVEINK